MLRPGSIVILLQSFYAEFFAISAQPAEVIMTFVLKLFHRAHSLANRYLIMLKASLTLFVPMFAIFNHLKRFFVDLNFLNYSSFLELFDQLSSSL